MTVSIHNVTGTETCAYCLNDGWVMLVEDGRDVSAPCPYCEEGLDCGADKFWRDRTIELEQLRPPGSAPAEDPASRERSMQMMRELAAKLGVAGAGSDEQLQARLEDFEQLGPGECDDCHSDVRLRVRYGKLAVCYGCAGSRFKAAQRAGSPGGVSS